MAYKKSVSGRRYPFLYNLTMSVGNYKSGQYVTTIAQTSDGHSNSPFKVSGWSHVSGHEKQVHHSASQPNKRDDVMLVQYLLKRVYQHGLNATPQLNPASGAAFLAIDGWHGPKTQAAIERYQLEMRQNGRNIAVDGCVDPEPGDSAHSTISQTAYTISWLNTYLYLLNPALFQDITKDPECPAELATALRRVM